MRRVSAGQGTHGNVRGAPFPAALCRLGAQERDALVAERLPLLGEHPGAAHSPVSTFAGRGPKPPRRAARPAGRRPSPPG